MGISVGEFARRCGLPRETLEAYERGRLRVPVSLVLRAWHAFSVSPDFLATGEGAPLLPYPEGCIPPNVDGDLRFLDVYPKLVPWFDAVDAEMRPIHIARLKEFLAAAESGRTPRGAAAAISDAITKAFPPRGPVKITILRDNSPSAAATPPPPIPPTEP